MMTGEKGAWMMQLLVDQARFARALQVIGRILPKRQLTPGVGGVALQAEPGRVRLCATDLQSFAELALDAEVHVAGEVAVDARTLASVVASLSSESVAISRSGSGESLRLTAGPASFRLRTLRVEDLPAYEPPAAWHLELPKEQLVEVVSRTTFCAADSDEVSPFSGVWLSGGGGRLTMAATDSFQLAYYSVEADALRRGESEQRLEGVLPTGGLNACANGLHHFGGERVAISWQDRTIAFRSDGALWLIRRLEVTYPDLSRFTGPIAGARVEVDRSRLLEAVRQVSTLAEDGYRIGLSLRGERLHLFTSRQELGEAQVVVQLDEEAPPREVWLDARGFAAALRAQPRERIALHLSEPLAPVVVVPAEPGVAFRTVLSPLRHYAAGSEAI